MIGAAVVADGFQTSVVVEVLEFLGAYFVGRAYVFGRPSQQTFVSALKMLIIVIVALAVLDNVAGRNIAVEAISTVLPTAGEANSYRMGMVRASSTFDGSTTLGLFCAASAAIFFYSEKNILKRAAYVGLCLVGCILALSSAPLMAFVIVMSAYSYDHLLSRFKGRWYLFVSVLILIYIALNFVSENPIASVIGHLTFDPSSGWFRANTWAHTTVIIAKSPWFGYGFNVYGNPEDFWDQASVDCVFLVMALRFGIPSVALLILTNILSFSNFEAAFGNRGAGPYRDNLETGFTLTLVAFLFVGITIHFWNAPWSMWGFLVGIRASFKEGRMLSGLAKAGDRKVLARPGRSFALSGRPQNLVQMRPRSE